jgi:signal transduction histidine kinase/Na+/proline symporter
VALILAAFSILFGTRSIDATERHEGLVVAIAFESIVKLLAFLVVGLFVTYSLFDGFGDLFAQASAVPSIKALMGMEAISGGYTNWFTLLLLSMTAILFLPRQFQVAVVENVNESHVRTASWLFPLYLLIINLFVLPIAFGGLLVFPQESIDPDTFVLTLPLFKGQETIALLVYLGGLSAATSMVIVATIALSIMVSNDLVMPVLLRIRWLGLVHRADLSQFILNLRRVVIVGVLILGYLYYRVIGESYALVTIGLVSFAAAAQFAPAILFGIYWKHASRAGALAGLSSGFVVWAFTLVLPSFVRSGWLPESIIEQGLFGISLLKPYALFGLSGLDSLSHSVFWSLFFNVGLLVLVSIVTRQSDIEKVQATLFVDVFRHSGSGSTGFWHGTATVKALRDLLARFLGGSRADREIRNYAKAHDLKLDPTSQASPALVNQAEHLLSGTIGAASSRVMISSVVQGEALNFDGVMAILDETSQVIEYSHRLEQKSRELERTTNELTAANERLKALDRLKDDFVSTVSHELRTPLTSIRAFTEILLNNPDVEEKQRSEFLNIVVKESERLTRLINQVLDISKIEASWSDWSLKTLDLRSVIDDALAATSQLIHDRGVELSRQTITDAREVKGDRDRLMQVVINLVSNAVKFCPSVGGKIVITLDALDNAHRISVSDNGSGIALAEQGRIFEKFHQVSDQQAGKPQGSGLGLPICKRIVELHWGRVWVASEPGQGATFFVSLPSAGGEHCDIQIDDFSDEDASTS